MTPTLNKLLRGPKTSGKSFFERCRDVAAQNRKLVKPKLSVVALKKAQAVMEASGKHVSGLAVNLDGSFHLTFGNPGVDTSENPWDEVLK
ncbi:hypothetical protein [Rhizobium ruizarguesonis]|uniref:hypothetical protein n=1 Tax=Rhizobium TaxID=379 RepID=UPI001031C22D|nr:hypothetical protein [Rhizobium ruizarguesonis]TBA91083.1 hypothetical protein ELH54_15225 [Rhizobium ruizarguesonis]